MSSGDVSHPICSSPTRPHGLAGTVHSSHALPTRHTQGTLGAVSTHSSMQPAHTTDMHDVGLVTCAVDTPEAQLLLSSQP